MCTVDILVISIYVDVDECFNKNGNCSHDCHNTEASYYCECHAGYILQPNKHDCEGEYTYIYWKIVTYQYAQWYVCS